MAHVDRSSLAFYSVTTLALMAQVTSTAITTTLTTTALVGRSIFSVAIAASIFEILALVALLAAVGLFLRRVTNGLILAVWIPGAIACLVGSMLAVVTLSRALHPESNNFTSEGADEQRTRDLAGAGIATAVIGFLLQAALWALIWPRQMKHSVLPIHDQLLPAEPVKQRTISVHLGSVGLKSSKAFFGEQHEPSSPLSSSHSHYSTSGMSSLRNSASESLDPMSSKTRLILQNSFGSRSSRGKQPSAEITTSPMRSANEFENWDTSRVKNSFESTYQKRAAVPRLEPIPGSRPVSPAHPLDGPFACEFGPEDSPLPASVALSPAMATTDPDESSIRNLPRLHTRRGSIPSIASPTGASSVQQHIHPLFRTESPAPPPLTSPGTVITASPYAGQIFSPEFALQSPRLLGSRDGSRPVSPALLSPMRSRAGSIKSCRTIPTTPTESSQKPLPDRSFSRLAEKYSRPGTPLSSNG